MPIIEPSIKLKSLEELLKGLDAEEMVLGIDVDNCVTDTNPVILDLANEMYYYPNPNPNYQKRLERPLRTEDITDFDYEKCTPLNEEEVNELFREMVNKEKYLNLKLLPYASQVINKLDRFFYMYFITARPENAKEQTLNCFKNNGIKNYNNRIIFDGNKVKISKENKITKFIEDRTETALKLAENGIKVYLFDYNWNNHQEQEIVQKINKHPKIERIYNTPKSYWLNIKEKLIK